MNLLTAVCPICGAAPSGATHVCPRCATITHEECWRYAGGCATYGCEKRRPTVAELSTILKEHWPKLTPRERFEDWLWDVRLWLSTSEISIVLWLVILLILANWIGAPPSHKADVPPARNVPLLVQTKTGELTRVPPTPTEENRFRLDPNEWKVGISEDGAAKSLRITRESGTGMTLSVSGVERLRITSSGRVEVLH